MSTSRDQRTFERIPFAKKVKVVSMGRMAAYAMAINIGMGGVLLQSAAPLPVGSKCQVAIPISGGDGIKHMMAEGTVVRSDTGGTAVKFVRTLDPSSLDTLLQQTAGASHNSILASYQTYFQVTRNKDLADCEKLLGVSKRTYLTTFCISFLSCISLAILPVWLYQNSIPAFPNWVKVALSFGYGAIWLAVIQPTIDLTAFHFLRQRHSSEPRA
jgi:heme/copper-type cytochrome/quinol oxidase subunit 4